MPGSLYSVVADGIALAAATAKTVLVVKASAVSVVTVVEWSIEFDGVTAANIPVKCEIRNDASAGGTTTAQTVVSCRPGQPTANATAGVNATVEPTYGGGPPAALHRITPTGLVIVQEPLGREFVAAAGASSWITFRLTAAQVVNATLTVKFEE
jgi:tripartite-type tricarboxylate transporter receptor subunit TctC